MVLEVKYLPANAGDVREEAAWWAACRHKASSPWYRDLQDPDTSLHLLLTLTLCGCPRGYPVFPRLSCFPLKGREGNETYFQTCPFPTSGGARMRAQSCLTLCDPRDCSPPGSSVHGIVQARILEWVAMPSSRESSGSWDQTCVSYVSCIGRWVPYH